MIGEIDWLALGVSVDYVRKRNLRVALEAIKRCGPISRADLARGIELSPPTVSSLVHDLQKMGLVEDANIGDSDRGRPPQLIRFNETATYVVGLELNATSIRASIATISGRIIQTIEKPNDRYIGVTANIDQCMGILNRLSAESGISWQEVLALTVAVPGIVNSETGEVILARNLLGWRQVPLGKLLYEAYKVPVTVENDLRMAALGEYAQGAAHGHNTFILIGLCEGAGSAIMINGQLLRGHHFLAGEIGYMRTCIDSDGTNRDYLESVIGIAVIREKILEELRRGRRSALEPLAMRRESELTLGKILACAEDGDPLALETIDHLANGLAFSITNMVSVCNPDLVVLWGDFETGGNLLLTEICRLVEDQLPFRPEIVLSSLGSKGIMAGTLQIAIRQAEENLLSRKVMTRSN